MIFKALIFYFANIYTFEVVILYNFIANAENLDILKIYYFISPILKPLFFKSKFAFISFLIFNSFSKNIGFSWLFSLKKKYQYEFSEI